LRLAEFHLRGLPLGVVRLKKLSRIHPQQHGDQYFRYLMDARVVSGNRFVAGLPRLDVLKIVVARLIACMYMKSGGVKWQRPRLQRDVFGESKRNFEI
jgi:hypothetical protein